MLSWKNTVMRCMHAITFCAVCLCVQGASLDVTLWLTITNPTPPGSDGLPSTFAVVGTDKIVIGCPTQDFPGAFNAGIAYLFSTNGSLLQTFERPLRYGSANFGFALAAIGDDKMIMASEFDDRGSDLGAAYLFQTNGTLLMTFTNPVPSGPSGNFGAVMAAIPPDRVIIADLYTHIPRMFSGAAYLFGTNGTLLSIFREPNAYCCNFFPRDLALVGDKIVCGSPQGNNSGGVVYVFNTNGTLFNTITNPTAASGGVLGVALAALGADRIIIGEPNKTVGGVSYAGTAYLFSLDGVRLATFTNPVPVSEGFGSAVAALGADKILIGAPLGDVGGPNSGGAYLFDTNGTLLATFKNPVPDAGGFGGTIKGVNTDTILIGAPYAGGGAYLFRISDPSSTRLSIKSLTSGTFEISWPRSTTGFVIECTSDLKSALMTNVWKPVLSPYGTNATAISVTVTGYQNSFFRLRN